MIEEKQVVATYEPVEERVETEPTPVEKPDEIVEEPVDEQVAMIEPSPVTAPVIELGLIASLEAEYMAQLRRAIEANKKYPRRAQNARREGTVSVSFTIDRQGHITSVRVDQSSGTAILDQAAMQAIQKLGRFDPIPEDIPRDTWLVKIPMSFVML